VRDEPEFGEVAVREGFVSREQLEACRLSQDGLALPEALRRRGLLTDRQVQAIHDILRVHAAESRHAPEPDGRPIALDRDQLRAALHDALRAFAEEGGTIGPYRLVEEIGRGASGAVFKAVHGVTGRTVALKLVRAPGSVNDAVLSRFRPDSSVTHPHIVAVHDTGQAEGVHFVAMELVEGVTLQRALAEGKSSLRELVVVLEKAARAVHHAHRFGIIHCDLKPANILIDPAGEPRLTDFGVARTVDAGPDAGPAFGTPYYMSPEQVEAAPEGPDARTDVYALGVMLYEILTGRVPHPGATAAGVYDHILYESPARPSTLRPYVDPTLEAACLRAIDRNPALRHRTAWEFADALRAWIDRP
jgi:serine/threonine protein kinase